MAINVGGQPLVVPKVQPIAEEPSVAEAVAALEVLPEEAQKLVGKAAADAKKKKPSAPASYKLSAIVAAVHKDKGTDKIIVAGKDIPDVKRIPTGCFEWDLATGGGFPRSRITIVYGPEGSGKTNMCLRAAAYVQKYFPPECNKVVYVNAEHSFDPTWAEMLGVNTAELVVVNPAYGEEAVDVCDALIRADDVALLIFDSIAMMVASKEIEGSVEKADVGTSSLLVKRLCNKLNVALAVEERKGHTPAVILINQTRFKIGVMFGDPETMPGGQTMKFLASLIIRIYGKNKMDAKVHPDLPAWKETNAVVKKAKIPIHAIEFSYDMCLQAGGDIDIGDTDSWTTVKGHLQATNKLTKVPGGWQLLSEVQKTQEHFYEQYVCDLAFRVKLQQEVIKGLNAKKFLTGGSGTEI